MIASCAGEIQNPAPAAAPNSCCSCKVEFPAENTPSKPFANDIARFKVWMKTPARIQVPYNPEVPQYVEGHEDFNVWFGKYLSDRRNPRDKDRNQAGTTCDPDKDSGWTQADQPGSGSPGFCLFFARGSCGFGHKCRYFHHVPTVLDMASGDEAHDIFGRERYSQHRDDMGGVGSFNDSCCTLFVGDLIFDRTASDAVESVQREMEDKFRLWGEVEDVRLVPSKAIGFVRYTWRCNAEFAKEAMNGQKLGLSKCILVNWARDDPRPDAKKRKINETRQQVEAALQNKAAGLGWTKPEIAAINTKAKPEKVGATGPYPDTDAQFKIRQSQLAFEGVVQQCAQDAAQSEAEMMQRTATANLSKLQSALARVEPFGEG